MMRFDERAGQVVPSYWHSDTADDVLDQRAKWHAEPRQVDQASSDVARERDAYERWLSGRCCGCLDSDGQCLAQIVQRDRLEILRRASSDAAVHRYCYRCEFCDGYESVFGMIGDGKRRQAEACRVWGLRFILQVEEMTDGNRTDDDGQSKAGEGVLDEDAGRQRDPAVAAQCLPRTD